MDREGLVPRILEFVLSRRLRHISQGWALRRGLLVHGRKTPIDYLRLTAEYVTERPEAIRCPTLICSAENDEIGVTARKLFHMLTCEKSFITFAADDGAGAHCEAVVETACISAMEARSSRVARRSVSGSPSNSRSRAR